MKLKTLTIHNIASIEDATIDFAGPELAGQDLFLICGPTGAGKSTILDAICLALFNTTPRIVNSTNDSIDLLAENDSQKKEKVKDVIHLVRKNAPDAWVELTFEGVDGQECTALWSVKRKIRKSKNDTDAKLYESEPLEEKLKRGVVKEWTITDANGVVYEKVTEVAERIQDIIKMNFEQFCKTTMLAQGDFTKFLSSSSDEKAQILEKLVGTEKYSEVGSVINQTTNEKRNDMLLLQRELEHLQFLSDEEIAQRHERIATLQQESTTLTAAKEAWAEVRLAMRQQQEADTEAEEQQKRQQQLQEEQALLPVLKEPEEELRRLHADTIDSDVQALHAHQLLVVTTQEKRLQWVKAYEDYKAKEAHIAEDTKKRNELKQKAQLTAKDLAQAEHNRKSSETAYERMKASMEDHARVLRAELKQGDTCPVCGKIVDEVLSNDRFAQILAPLKEAFEADKAAHEQCIRLNNLAQTNALAADRTLIQRRNDLQSALNLQNELLHAVRTHSEQLGLTADATLKDRLAEMAAANEQKQQKIQERQQQIRVIREGQTKWNEWSSKVQLLKAAMEQTARKKQAAQQVIQAFLDANPGTTLAAGEMERIQTRLTAVLQEIGRIHNELDTDARTRATQGEKKKQLDLLQAEYAEWKTLDNYLGSTDGKYFRNVAQSFILGDLLDKANAYLENITGRYTLFCNPGTLTIMMRDAYQGGVVRPTNTLSGGESFIISLSLALGLSSMQSVGFEVDTLFIDEGFGTLSPEFLDPVITSLKLLYEQYGRRVGIISHVETLRARIPVTIEVTREGNSSSRVSLINNG